MRFTFIAGIVGVVVIVAVALAVYEGLDWRLPLPAEPLPLRPLPTGPPPPTPQANQSCPPLYHPLAPIGLTVAALGDRKVDVRWAMNASYRCRGADGAAVDMACGMPKDDFLGYDVRWAVDDGPEHFFQLRPDTAESGALDPCSYWHTTLDRAGARAAAYQVRAVSSLYVSPWSGPAYLPSAAAASFPPATPTATPGPTPTPGGPTATPHPQGDQETVWLVAYDPDAGTLPGARVPGLPGTVALTGWQPAAGGYLEFANLPHCSGSKRFWVVWPDAWPAPDRYSLVSPTGGVAPVLERAWARTLAGVEIQGVDREYWRMAEVWHCSAVAGQHLRVYIGS